MSKGEFFYHRGHREHRELLRNFAVALLLAVVTFAVFTPALRNQFVGYDDPGYVTDNATVQGGLTARGFVWAFTTGHMHNWHPLTWLSHMLDCQLYGLDPLGHHFTSVLIHAANAGLLFLILHAMTNATAPSLIAAALFALHPLRVESVAWVAERKDVLSLFFGLLTIAAYVGYARKTTVTRYASVVLLFVLGLLSKPMLVTLPFLLLLLDYWPLQRLDRGRILRVVAEKAPLFMLALASSLITYLVQARTGTLVSTETVSLSVRLANAVYSYVAYLENLFWPAQLAFYYSHYGEILSAATVIFAVTFLIGVTIGVCVARRRAPYLLVGWFWYIGTLVPVIGLVQVGGAGMADRYTYLPQIGIAISVAWGMDTLARKNMVAQRLLYGVVIISLIALSTLTLRQIATWRDSYTLYHQALAVVPVNPQVHYLLSRQLSRDERNEEARAELETTLRLDPDHYQALNNLGSMLARNGDFGNASVCFQRAIDIEPNAPTPRINLATILIDQHRFDEALEHLRVAFQRLPPTDPDYAQVKEVLERLETRTDTH